MLKQKLVDLRNYIDRKLKFPNVKKGDTVIQIGFDMSSQNLTSDLFILREAVGKKGIVIGIDPDPLNHERVKKILNTKGWTNIQLVEKATWSEKKIIDMIVANRASHNILSNIDTDNIKNFTEKKIKVQCDSIDNIIQDLKLDINKISHINITNNGAEYSTLLGMENLLNQAKNISLTVIAGRTGSLGIIEGKEDYILISDLLKSKKFTTKFYRLSELIWSVFFHYLLLKHKWYFGKKIMGVVFAVKGNKKIPFYQSYS